MDFIELTDQIIRFLIIGFLFFCGVYTMYLGRKEKDVTNKKNFNLSFAMFFFLLAINYLWTEVDIFISSRTSMSAYPMILPTEEYSVWGLFNPQNSDPYMFFLFLLAIVPMLYALEKFVLNRERVWSTILGTIGIALLGAAFIFNEILFLLDLAIAYGFLMLVLLSLRVIIIYLTFASQVTGEIRRLGLFIGFGFMIILLGVIGTSLEDLFGTFSEIIGHSINLLGMILIFMGVLKMK